MTIFDRLLARRSATQEPLPSPPRGEVSINNYGFFVANAPVELWSPDRLVAGQGADIYRRMLRDDQVKAAYQLVVDTIVGRQFRFVPDSEGDDEAQAKQIEFLEFNLEKTLRGTFANALKQILTSTWSGYSVNEIIIEPVQWRRAMQWVWRALKLRPFETFRFKVDQFGNVLAVIQDQAYGKKEFDPRRFVIHVNNRELDSIYGESDLRACYRHWWAKQNILRFQEIGIERYAVGFAVAKINPGGGLTASSRTELQNSLNNLQAAASITVPEGVDIEIVQNEASDVCEKAISQRDQAIARALLMPNLLGLTPEQSVGSMARSKVQQDVFFNVLSRRGDDLADTLNEQLFGPVLNWNFGAGPQARMEFEQYTDEEKREIVKTFIEAVKGGIVANTFDDETRNRELLGYEAREEEEPDLMPEEEEPTPGDQDDQEEEEEQDQESEDDAPDMAASFADRQPLQDRMDFRGAERDMDAQGRIAGEAVAARVDAIWQDVRDAMPEMTIEAIEASVQPQKKGALRQSLIDHLRTAYDQGRKTAIREMDKAGAMAAPRMRAHIAQAARISAKRAAIGEEWTVAQFVSGLQLETAERYFAQRAFTITGQVTEDILNAAKTVLLNGIRDELTVEAIITELEDVLSAAIGERDAAGRRINIPARLETIVRTTYTDAFNQARLAVFTDPELGDFVEAFKYSAILDAQTTPFCRNANGVIYPVDDPFWNMATPPNHFNCRSLLIPVTVVDEWEASPQLPSTVIPAQGFGRGIQ